ncbi:hypothetical protein QE152_g12874 [Popillia japonica]|uniref:DNA topoisomerase n=1 Tax=Popillia japonica TaxID=7064 RepID=A0AAW1LBL8_POPJA
MKKGNGCNNCSHPNCAYSLNTNGVSSCVECELGVLVLDPSSGPKWKLGCNRCDIIINLFEDAQKIAVIDEEVCECGAQLVTVEYKSDKTKFADDRTEMSGCIFCSPHFSNLVEKHKAVSFARSNNRRPVRPNNRVTRGGARPKPKDKMAQLAAYFV